jgi:hypothetical protein
MFLGDQIDINDRMGAYRQMANSELQGRILDVVFPVIPNIVYE